MTNEDEKLTWFQTNILKVRREVTGRKEMEARFDERVKKATIAAEKRQAEIEKEEELAAQRDRMEKLANMISGSSSTGGVGYGSRVSGKSGSHDAMGRGKMSWSDWFMSFFRGEIVEGQIVSSDGENSSSHVGSQDQHNNKTSAWAPKGSHPPTLPPLAATKVGLKENPDLLGRLGRKKTGDNTTIAGGVKRKF